jgi:hypothetical protein
MKPIAAFCLALIGTVALAAQTAPIQAPTQTPTQPGPGGTASTEGLGTATTYNSATQKTMTIVIPMQPGSCPASVRAQQSSTATAMEVDSNRPKGPAQLLHLTLARPDSNRITGATVKVRGLLPKARATLTPMTLGADPSDAIRTLSVAFPNTSDKNATADLWVPGLSAVYSIDLVSVTYADGSTWRLAGGKTCRTPIDGVMLVGGR